MSNLNGRLTRREFLKEATQAGATAAVAVGAASAATTLVARAGDAVARGASRISYFCNGEIHVNEVGKLEGRPLTKGHMDFKPSWSKTGNMLVCFQQSWKAVLVRLSALDRWRGSGGVSPQPNRERTALRVPIGGRLDRACVHQLGRRLPVSTRRSGSVLNR